MGTRCSGTPKVYFSSTLVQFTDVSKEQHPRNREGGGVRVIHQPPVVMDTSVTALDRCLEVSSRDQQTRPFQ
jgi:hypothetical protein